MERYLRQLRNRLQGDLVVLSVALLGLLAVTGSGCYDLTLKPYSGGDGSQDTLASPGGRDGAMSSVGSGGIWRLTFLTQMRFDVESSETKSV